MGWRGQHNRDEDAREEWKRLPLRERYDWRGIALTVALIGAALVARVIAFDGEF
jgi:hypothetical protein